MANTEKKTYTVTSPLRCGGDYAIGDQVDLDDATAAGLIALQVVAALPEGIDPSPLSGADRQAAIIAAIGLLDPESPELWLQDGRPSASAIATQLGGETVAAAERDAAWEAIQAKAA